MSRRFWSGLAAVAVTSYVSYAVVRHADELELWARIVRDELARRWHEDRTFRHDRKRVMFEAYVATREAATDGRG